MTPILTTRLALRAPRDGDVVRLAEALGEEDADPLPAGVLGEASMDEASVEAPLVDRVLFGVPRERADDDDAPLLLAIGLHARDATGEVVELGYWRRGGLGGQGWVDEAVAAVVDVAFQALGVRRLEVRIPVGHVPSVRVAERAGFRRDEERSGAGTLVFILERPRDA